MVGRSALIPILAITLLLCTTSLSANPKDDIPEEVIKLLAGGQVPEGVLMARGILDQAEDTYGVDSLEAAEASQNLSLVLSFMKVGEKAERVSLAERALDTKRRLLDPRSPSLAASLYVLGQAYYQAFDYPGASQHFMDALEIIDDYYGPHHEVALVYVREYGSALQQTGKYQQALEAFNRQATISSDAYGQASPVTLSALRNVALSHMNMDQYEEAGQILLDSIKLLVGDEDSDQQLLATTRRSYSVLLTWQGQFDEALLQGELALDLGRRFLTNTPGWIPRLLNNMAATLLKIGDWQKARRYLEESIGLQEEGSQDPLLAFRSRLLMAMAEFEGSRGEAALEQLMEAKLAATGKIAPDNLVWNTFFQYRARVRASLDEHSSALSDYEQALKIRSGKDLNEDFDTAELHAEMAISEMNSGNPDAALDKLLTASRIMEPITGRTHPAYVKILDDLALARWRSGQIEEAADTGLEAAEAALIITRATVSGLPERQALAFTTRKISGDDIAVASAIRLESNQQYSSHAFDILIRSRAVVFDELVKRRKLASKGTDPDTDFLAGELRAAKEYRANLFLADPADYRGSYSDKLDQARNKIETLEASLAEYSSRNGKLSSNSDFDSHDLAQVLPRGGASVSYFTYREPSLGGTTRYIAVVQTSLPTHSPRLIDLGPAQRINAAVSAWRDALLPEAVLKRDTSAAEKYYKNVASTLRQLIWDPISDLVADADIVFIIPDGVIGLVSFSALSQPDGSYLLENGPVLHYLTAERDLAGEPSAQRNTEGLLAIGNPSFDLKRSGNRLALKDPESTLRSGFAECSNLRSLRFTNLPETRIEAKSVRKIWKGFNKGERAMLLLGADATEETFKANASGRSTLHIATHGFFLGDGCSESSPTLRGIGGLSRQPARHVPHDRFSGENPLLLSGLVFAGANQRGTGLQATGDGIVTAQEISILDLDSVNLAVLSACRTGTGTPMTGEGVFGLQRAFLLAGADSIVTNLWDVEDESGRSWILTFYQEYLKGGSTLAHSVRQAGLVRLADRRDRKQSTHPFYWGGWLASGLYQ